MSRVCGSHTKKAAVFGDDRLRPRSNRPEMPLSSVTTLYERPLLARGRAVSPFKVRFVRLGFSVFRYGQTKANDNTE